MAAEDKLVADIAALSDRLAEARASIERRFVGQHAVVEQVLAAILAGGHALLVGQPGLGKTMLVDTLSTVLGLDSGRIQFTPDLMPADILGAEVLDILPDGTRAFRFIEGPVFTQLLMADEINRASPRTQSALLQAMAEGEVTISGAHRPLGRPFHVLATQNPIEQEGTYPLPEAQLDRFLVQVEIGYPDRATERAILLATTGSVQDRPHRVLDAAALIEAQALVRAMPGFMKVLTVIGTAAMIWVGGNIVIHGLHELGYHAPYDFIHAQAERAAHAVPAMAGAVSWFVTALIDGIFGLALGLLLIPLSNAVIAPLWRAGQRAVGKA